MDICGTSFPRTQILLATYSNPTCHIWHTEQHYLPSLTYHIRTYPIILPATWEQTPLWHLPTTYPLTWEHPNVTPPPYHIPTLHTLYPLTWEHPTTLPHTHTPYYVPTNPYWPQTPHTPYHPLPWEYPLKLLTLWHHPTNLRAALLTEVSACSRNQSSLKAWKSYSIPSLVSPWRRARELTKEVVNKDSSSGHTWIC